MARRIASLVALLALAWLGHPAAPASTISFSGYPWDVRDSTGGHGPNTFSPDNVWVDGSGFLHLQITEQNGQWSCAEVALTQSLGFGTYQFQVIGRIDQLDTNVVLGLFNYGTPDGLNEIDIEHGRFGDPDADIGHYTVYPSQLIQGYTNTTHAFPVALDGTFTTQRFDWRSDRVTFQSLFGHQDDNSNEYEHWVFQPNDPTLYIPQKPAPVLMNLWLFQGQPPTDGMPVEIIISSFTFTPTGVPEPAGAVLLGLGLLGLIGILGAGGRSAAVARRRPRP